MENVGCKKFGVVHTTHFDARLLLPQGDFLVLWPDAARDRADISVPIERSGDAAKFIRGFCGALIGPYSTEVLFSIRVLLPIWPKCIG